MALQKLYTNKALVAERSREEVVSLEQDLYIKVTEVGVLPRKDGMMESCVRRYCYGDVCIGVLGFYKQYCSVRLPE